ncbi:MAG TPA: hypothetical protein VHO91_10505 [Rhodopila sp.]|nr:hypothetical protein [Rhodopila sp.]
MDDTTLSSPLIFMTEKDRPSSGGMQAPPQNGRRAWQPCQRNGNIFPIQEQSKISFVVIFETELSMTNDIEKYHEIATP